MISPRRCRRRWTASRSRFYAWCAQPKSARQLDDESLAGLLKQAWLESGGDYGYRKLTLDMRDLGEHCGKHRVARLLKSEGLRSKTGCRRRAHVRGGKPLPSSQPVTWGLG